MKSQQKPGARTAPPADPVDVVISKYAKYGWTTLRPPPGTNDLIAQKGNKLHFVRVVTEETADDVRFHGLPKNEFVQNAMSNSAQPIFARVSGKPGAFKVTFEDVNTARRVIIGAARRA